MSPLRTFACVFALIASSTVAHADDAACIDANAEAQKLERAGKLKDARAKLVACGSESCPSAVRADCAAILARVDASQPTLAVEVRDASGAATTRARVMIDGEPSADAAGGRAVSLDPGEHMVVAELDALRRQTTVVVVQGEKDKRVRLDFLEHKLPPTESASFKVPWLAWTFGAIAVASGGVAIGFGVHGDDLKGTLDETCRGGRTCSDAQYQDMATTFTIANVLIGIAAGAAVAAIITTIVWPRSKPSTTVGSMLLHGRF